MHPLIARLDRWLARNRAHYYEHDLRPGAPLELLDTVLDPAAPPLLRELLAWRNGDNFGSFHENRSLMPAADIREAMTLMSELALDGEFEVPNWWCQDWIPFLDGAGGDKVCVDVRAVIGGKPGQVLEFWHDDPVRPITHGSFDEWLSTFVDALEAGLLVEDEDGTLVEAEGYDTFAAARNPAIQSTSTSRRPPTRCAEEASPGTMNLIHRRSGSTAGLGGVASSVPGSAWSARRAGPGVQRTAPTLRARPPRRALPRHPAMS